MGFRCQKNAPLGTGGKPSIWFPPEKIVELALTIIHCDWWLQKPCQGNECSSSMAVPFAAIKWPSTDKPLGHAPRNPRYVCSSLVGQLAHRRFRITLQAYRGKLYESLRGKAKPVENRVLASLYKPSSAKADVREHLIPALRVTFVRLASSR